VNCRAHVLAQTLAFFDGNDLEDAEPCQAEAVYSTRVIRIGEGTEASITTEVCPRHDTAARSDEGYAGTWKLRVPAAT
jgi:hypothetical protein